VVILIIGAAAVAASGSTAKSGGGGSGSTSASDLGAFDVCQQAVKPQLKAPGSATFRDPLANNGDTTITHIGNVYTVVSSVDAENSFGAKLRTGFTCTATYVSGDQWNGVSATLDSTGP
jgi:hypothetical protein